MPRKCGDGFHGVEEGEDGLNGDGVVGHNYLSNTRKTVLAADCL